MPARYDLIDGAMEPAAEGAWVRFEDWEEIERIRQVQDDQLRQLIETLKARRAEGD